MQQLSVLLMMVLDWSNDMEVRKEEALHQSLLDKLKVQIKECGVLGAGGAGFPTYAKLDVRCETIILNCAECEPLLKLHQQVLRKYAKEILTALKLIGEAVSAKRIVIAIKAHYKGTIEVVQALLDEYPNIEIHLLHEIYPMGDEVILTHEVTNQVVPTGGIPIDIGVAVFNVETILNIYHAVTKNQGVTHKYVTVTGAVSSPTTFLVPVGITVKECIDYAGGVRIEDYAILMGGPMTGRIVLESDRISKTTNGILVLPKNNPVVKKLESNTSMDMKRAYATCCQCEMCSDLCPRNQIGIPVSPSNFMKAATNSIDLIGGKLGVIENAMLCCSCGLCELYACPQGLSPRKLIAEFKVAMRAKGIAIPKGLVINEISPMAEYRKVPMERLMERLDLITWNHKAPLYEKEFKVDTVKISLGQHIGAKSVACVMLQDVVRVGDCIARSEKNALSLPTHASIDGMVVEINENEIVIKRVQ